VIQLGGRHPQKKERKRVLPAAALGSYPRGGGQGRKKEKKRKRTKRKRIKKKRGKRGGRKKKK